MVNEQADQLVPVPSLMVSSAGFAAVQLVLFWQICTVLPGLTIVRIALASLDLLTLVFFLLWIRHVLRERFLRTQAGELVLEEQSDDFVLSLEMSYMQNSERLEQMAHEQMLLCEFADDVLFVLSPAGVVATTNQGTARHWGIASNIAVGKDFADFIAADERGRFPQLLDATQSSKTAATDEFRMQSSLTEHCYSRITVEWSETQQLFFCVAVDVSDKKMLENIKREYAAMLTHDLKAPLSSVKLALENLQDKADASGREVNAALAAVSQLSTLVGKLILLDQSEAGELKFQKRMFPISDVVAGSMEIVQPIATSCSVSLRSELGEHVIWCDQQALLQVFANLLSNALRYAPPDSAIEIADAVTGSQLEITISDAGPGVADADKPRIFERYKTGDIQLKGQHGTGLGLAVVKAIVEAQGGRVGVRDRPGGGAQFFFTLEIASEEDIG